MRKSAHRFLFAFALAFGCAISPTQAVSCVWKVSAPNGGTLYLGGSAHALRSSDYPLPPAFNRALDASSRIVFEIDAKAFSGSSGSLVKAGKYPKGDSLKKHVDPRTYAYLRRLFGLIGVSEDKYANLRPWYITLLLSAPSAHGLSQDLGVEGFLIRRAQATSKPISGLETLREHIEIFSGLTDRQSEALLLLTFIPQASGTNATAQMVEAWRRGDADLLTRETLAGFRDFPSLGDRILNARNRNWIPKIDSYLSSGQTYFVVAGAAHMGGANGLVALLRARGCKVEQL